MNYVFSDINPHFFTPLFDAKIYAESVRPLLEVNIDRNHIFAPQFLMKLIFIIFSALFDHLSVFADVF
jgi:hypothetical protein